VETTKAIRYAITHAGETVRAIASSYAEKAGTARGIGEIVGEVAMMAAGGYAAAKAVSKVAEVARGAKVAESATRGSRVFWSGGRAAEKAAEDFATKTGGVTLGNNGTGRFLSNLTGRIELQSY